MTKSVIIRVAVICFPVGLCAQESTDLSALVFVPGHIMEDARQQPFVPSGQSADEDRTAEEYGEDRLFESLAVIEESIAEEESLNGPRSSALVASFISLAELHERLGNHFLAIAALERARGISRANDGLNSLNQAEIVERMIETLEASGQFRESDLLQDSLLDLVQRSDGDARAPFVLASVADRQMAAVNRYLDEGIWPRDRVPIEATDGSGWEKNTSRVGRHKANQQLQRIYDSHDAEMQAALGDENFEIGDPIELAMELDELYRLIDTANDCVEDGNDRPALYRCDPIDPIDEPDWELAPTDRQLALAAFRRARRLYSAAMQAAFSGESYGEYLGLQRSLLETYYFELAHPELHGPSCYRRSCPRPRRIETLVSDMFAGALQAKVIERWNQGAPAIDVAQAMLELADWQLLLSRNREALELYRDAYGLLFRERVQVEEIAGLFSPDVPAILTVFASDSTPYDPAKIYRGYADVSVEIGRYGQARGVEILSASPGASPAIERRLGRHVLQTRFRPRFEDGEPLRSDRFTLRYYFDY